MKEVLVIKIGGSTLKEEDLTVKNIAGLHQQGLPMVIVHGGGKEIDQSLANAGIKSKKIDGQRVTDAETLNIVLITLAGINKRLTAKLKLEGVATFATDPYSWILQGEIEDQNLGFVGKVRSVKASYLLHELEQGKVPILSPIAKSLEQPFWFLNVNADLAAAAVASSLPQSSLVLLTDVPGVQDKEGNLLNQLSFGQYQKLKEEGVVEGGMIPKLDAAFSVVASGKRVLICHYSNLAGVLGNDFIGTEMINTKGEI